MPKKPIKATKKVAKKIVPDSSPKKETNPKEFLKKIVGKQINALKKAQELKADLDPKIELFKKCNAISQTCLTQIDAIVECNGFSVDEVNKIVGFEYLRKKEE